MKKYGDDLIYLIFDFVKLNDNVLWFAIVLAFTDNLLFAKVIRQINPFVEYKITHPLKIARFIVFSLIAIANLYWIKC